MTIIFCRVSQQIARWRIVASLVPAVTGLGAGLDRFGHSEIAINEFPLVGEFSPIVSQVRMASTFRAER